MKFRIIHTNDLHSHLEQWDALAAMIDSQQARARQEEIPLLTIDVGDAIDFAHPLVEATEGQIIVD